MSWKRRTYLDVAAGFDGNPSSPHEEGRKSREVLEGARIDIARLLEVQSDDVIFTSGATEANALAILGLARQGDHVLYLPSAHASIVENTAYLKERGVNSEPLVITGGRIDIADLKNRVRPETKLVTIEAVCGETGAIWNTREVKQAIGNTYLHVDASQAPLTEKITRAHFGADLLTLDASKIGAVRGIGALIAHWTIPLTPLYRGGGQERGLRSGSGAPELARVFAVALAKAVAGREGFCAAALRDRVELIALISTAVPDVCINEERAQAPHILNLSFPGRDTDYLVALLDDAGFSVSTRSACESARGGSASGGTDSEAGSRAVFALSGDRERARATLRISWGPETSVGELERFARALAGAVAFVDKGIGG